MFQPAQAIGSHIGFSLPVPDRELIWLEREVPLCQATVPILHGVHVSARSSVSRSNSRSSK